MADTIASWYVSLDCNCTNCTMSFNLLEIPDFFDRTGIVLAESGTENSRGIEVSCPDCKHKFTVDCEY